MVFPICRKSDTQGFSCSYNLLSIERKVKWSLSMKEIIEIRAFFLPACFILRRCSGRGANKHRSPDCNEELPGSSLSVGVLFSLLWGCLKWQNRAPSWRNWETSLFLSALLGLCGTSGASHLTSQYLQIRLPLFPSCHCVDNVSRIHTPNRGCL